MTDWWMRKTYTVMTLAALFAIGFTPARGQYYEEREYRPTDTRYIYLGAMKYDFAPRSSNTAPDSMRINCNKLMPVIGFRQGPVDIIVGYTRFDQRGNSNAAIFVGTTVSTELPIAGRRGSALVVPIMIAADYTKAESGGPQREDFNVASVGLGAGLKYQLSTESVDFSVHAAEVLQYATEGFSVGSGFSAATLGDATLVLREVILNGIALGYRFRYQTWSMSDAQFNYRAISHGPSIGILF
jgi:hypothetical protein